MIMVPQQQLTAYELERFERIQRTKQRLEELFPPGTLLEPGHQKRTPHHCSSQPKAVTQQQQPTRRSGRLQGIKADGQQLDREIPKPG